MKKIVAKFLSLALMLTVVLSMFCACDLITVDKDKDMNQVIATVQINDEVLAEDIYKKELNAGFLSYGYQYIQNGYTVSQAYQTVLDRLVSNKVIIQHSKYELAKGDSTKLSSNATEDLLKNFFDSGKATQSIEDKYIEAQIQYNLKKNINDLIEAYVEEDDEEDDKEAEETPTARTVPTVSERDFTTSEKFQSKAIATEDELDNARVILKYEYDDAKFLNYLVEYYNASHTNKVTTATVCDVITVGELDLAVYAKYEIDENSTREIRKARKELLNFLNENGLILECEVDSTNKLVTMSYFVSMENTLVEQAIVTKYEDTLKGGSEATLSIDNLWTEYVREYNSQNTKFTADTTAYESALDAISDTSFVLANPYENYGYVMHILIPFSTEQTAQLEDFAKENPDDEDALIAEREKVAKNIVAKDQRDSWVYSSYGTYDDTAKSFIFSDKYHVDGANTTLLDTFQGQVIVRDKDGYSKDYAKKTWNFENVIANEIKFDKFVTDYVTPITGIEAKYFADDEVGVLTDYADAEKAKLIRKNFSDLMFAFSTDTGSLNKEYGYSYSPLSSDTNYVAKFAAASQAVVARGEGSYTIVVSEYGYHIILCTKKVVSDPPYEINETGKTAFVADLADEDSLAYKFKQTKLDSLISIDIQAISQGKINASLNDTNTVKYNEKAYSDLIVDEG